MESAWQHAYPLPTSELPTATSGDQGRVVRNLAVGRSASSYSSQWVFRATLGLMAMAIAALILPSVAARSFWSSALLVIASGALGWTAAHVGPPSLAERLTSRSQGGLSASQASTREGAALPSRDYEDSLDTELVKDALRNLRNPAALALSPLCHKISGASGDAAAADLRALLLEVIGELTMSKAPRDAEAGRLLLDYYVNRVGSHEIVMERLHLSRPTFYRRLNKGFLLIASQLQNPNVPFTDVWTRGNVNSYAATATTTAGKSGLLSSIRL